MPTIDAHFAKAQPPAPRPARPVFREDPGCQLPQASVTAQAGGLSEGRPLDMNRNLGHSLLTRAIPVGEQAEATMVAVSLNHQGGIPGGFPAQDGPNVLGPSPLGFKGGDSVLDPRLWIRAIASASSGLASRTASEKGGMGEALTNRWLRPGPPMDTAAQSCHRTATCWPTDHTIQQRETQASLTDRLIQLSLRPH